MTPQSRNSIFHTDSDIYTVLISTSANKHLLFSLQGLVVVDVYSEWSGPCSAMTNFLKKIKLEVNDDLLHYAMAKSDTIPQVRWRENN